MMRWWWFGPDVDRAELLRELDEMMGVGIGGVELAVVYPLTSAPDRYLSEHFLGDVRFAAEAARDRGMRFDLTLGSGWSFGGPHIDDTLAARKLTWDRREIGPAPLRVECATAWPGDEWVAAFVGDGSLQEPPLTFVELPIEGGTVTIPEGCGPRVVLTAQSRLTGQNVKRAAYGAEGPVFDHYSRQATQAHIRAVCDPLLDTVPGDLLGSVFCDSLEVYGSDWTPRLAQEFEERRGYPLLPELWRLVHDSDDSYRFRSDYYQTLTELAEAGFLDTMTQWAHSRGVEFRAQVYGEPPLSISSFSRVDHCEGEGWGWKDITQTRLASSAAQLLDRVVVSSETWTWNHSPSFRATPLDLVGELHEHALCGINHFIGHGWPYAPPGDGIGNVFYAAGALDERNPWWPAMGPLVQYAQRLAWTMRQGRRIADVGVYIPLAEVRSRLPELGTLDLWRAARTHIGDEVTTAIRERGLDFDLFDDPALPTLDPARFRAVVIPEVRQPSDALMHWLARAEAAGVTILHSSKRDDLTWVGTLDDIAPAMQIRDLDGGGRSGLGITHRVSSEVEFFLLANTDAVERSVMVQAPESRRCLELWSLADGVVSALPSPEAPLTLAPFAAVVLVSHAGPSAEPSAIEERGDEIETSNWTVRFPEERDARTVVFPHRWADDPHGQGMPTEAEYRCEIRVPDGCAAAELDFGPVVPAAGGESGEIGIRGRSYRVAALPPIGEVASVEIDGASAGVVWRPPYRLSVRGVLPGRHDLRITVYATAAERLVADEPLRERIRASERRFGRRFTMQNVSAAEAGARGGLAFTPRLHQLRGANRYLRPHRRDDAQGEQ